MTDVVLVQIDELEALMIVYLIMDALGVLMVDHELELPRVIEQGAVLLADELLRRVWPSIRVDRLGEEARGFREHVATGAACVRRDHHLVVSDTVQ